MPQPACKRCHQPLTPVYPAQDEHPLCSPTATGWIPDHHDGHQGELPAAEPTRRPVRQPVNLADAIELAALSWHILPLTPAGKRPLGNCPACDTCTGPPHPIEDCPCIPAGRWCHGVRAATTDPARLAAWWRDEPRAVPGIAAGPSGLLLIDIDAHRDQLPPDLATGLLPGINLTTEPIARQLWNDPARFRDGRDTMGLLAALRGGPCPWPSGPGHQPAAVATPGGGRHLWYRAPAPGLRQALSDPDGRFGLAWQVDVKAGWSYGVAPGAVTEAGTYRALSGDLAKPGDMPGWLASEVTRVAGRKPTRPTAVPAPVPASGHRGAAYVTTVIDRGARQLAVMGERRIDGRKRALAKLAYHVGGLLEWSGLTYQHVADRLTDAGIACGLPTRDARRITSRGLANGLARPVTPPSASGRAEGAA